MQDFKHLRFWQRAHALAVALNMAAQKYGRLGHAGLKAQLISAVESIAANIVEGCGAASKREFARFLDISIKSANETEYHLFSARDYRLMHPDDWRRHSTETVEIRKMIFAYRKKLLDDAE